MEFGLERGWMKLVSAAGSGMRVRTPSATINVNDVNDAIIVTRQDGKAFELFIESGSARIAETARTGRECAVNDAKSDEYWFARRRQTVRHRAACAVKIRCSDAASLHRPPREPLTEVQGQAHAARRRSGNNAARGGPVALRPLPPRICAPVRRAPCRSAVPQSRRSEHRPRTGNSIAFFIR